jgi:hypothetical protein
VLLCGGVADSQHFSLTGETYLKMKAILILVAILAVVGTTYYFISRPKPPAEEEPRYYVWDFDMENLQHITISLPKNNLSQSFVKHADDRNFYFDVENGPKVDTQRWGGGIPLLLSGPGANRLIFQEVTDTQLAEYGFNAPNLTATLTLSDESIYEVQVGDSNPEGTNYYVRLASNRDIYTVDKSWYEILAGIVTNNPYVAATFAVDRPTVSASEVTAGTPVTISIKVTNNGDLPGSYDLIMKINSELRETKSVTLAARANAVVTFTATENKAGKYIVSINTRNVTFTVK